MVPVSVVVPTYRRPHLLERCLEALARQDLEADRYEILVADDAASNATREQVEAWARRSQARVRYLAVKGPHGPAAARNQGWRAAEGELIAFTDDDCVPDPGWLRAGVAAFTPCAVAVCGRLVMPVPPRPTDYELNSAGLQQGEFVTANCFCRKSALEKINGFDERFRLAWREDSDLQFRLLAEGDIVRAPDAVVVHPIRPAGWGVSLKQQKNNVYDALLYKKHPELYRQRIKKGPPLFYYATAAFFLAGLLGALFGALAVAAAGAIAWLACAVRFAGRRLARTSRAPAHVAEVVVTSLLIPIVAVYWRLRGALRFRVLFF